MKFIGNHTELVALIVDTVSSDVTIIMVGAILQSATATVVVGDCNVTGRVTNQKSESKVDIVLLQQLSGSTVLPEPVVVVLKSRALDLYTKLESTLANQIDVDTKKQLKAAVDSLYLQTAAAVQKSCFSELSNSQQAALLTLQGLPNGATCKLADLELYQSDATTFIKTFTTRVVNDDVFVKDAVREANESAGAPAPASEPMTPLTIGLIVGAIVLGFVIVYLLFGRGGGNDDERAERRVPSAIPRTEVQPPRAESFTQPRPQAPSAIPTSAPVGPSVHWQDRAVQAASRAANSELGRKAIIVATQKASEALDNA
jgi:hypothetical protein